MATTSTWYVAVLCPRCGRDHRLDQCPQVKSIEYRKDGRTIRRVEFFEGGGLQTPTATATATSVMTVAGIWGSVAPNANEEEK